MPTRPFDRDYSGEIMELDDRPGIAWHIIKHEEIVVLDDEGYAYDREETHAYICMMVGDDRPSVFDPSEFTILTDEQWCGQCGQVGCGHG